MGFEPLPFTAFFLCRKDDNSHRQSSYSWCRRRNICLCSRNLGWPVPLELVGTRGADREQDHAQGQEKRWGLVLGYCWASHQGYIPQLCLCGYWCALQSGFLSALLRNAKGNIWWWGSFSQKWVMGHIEHCRYSVWQGAFGRKCGMASSF